MNSFFSKLKLWWNRQSISKKISAIVALLITTALTTIVAIKVTSFMNGPKVSIKVWGTLTSYPDIPDGEYNALYIFPASLYNEGDKIFYIKSIELKVLIDEEWTDFEKSAMDSSEILGAHHDSLVITDTLKMRSLDDLTEIPVGPQTIGRFLFRPPTNIRFKPDHSTEYKYCIILTDKDDKKIYYEDKIAYNPFLKDVYMPQQGINVR